VVGGVVGGVSTGAAIRQIDKQVEKLGDKKLEKYKKSLHPGQLALEDPQASFHSFSEQ
jgi:hypothetical protein